MATHDMIHTVKDTLNKGQPLHKGHHHIQPPKEDNLSIKNKIAGANASLFGGSTVINNPPAIYYSS